MGKAVEPGNVNLAGQLGERPSPGKAAAASGGRTGSGHQRLQPSPAPPALGGWGEEHTGCDRLPRAQQEAGPCLLRCSLSAEGLGQDSLWRVGKDWSPCKTTTHRVPGRASRGRGRGVQTGATQGNAAEATAVAGAKALGQELVHLRSPLGQREAAGGCWEQGHHLHRHSAPQTPAGHTERSQPMLGQQGGPLKWEPRYCPPSPATPTPTKLRSSALCHSLSLNKQTVKSKLGVPM